MWDAVRDFGALHRRLVPGFVTAVELEGTTRTVTFANGTQAREVLVDSDDQARRLVYAVVGGRLTAHSASVQVFAEGKRNAESSGSPIFCRTSCNRTSPARWTKQSRR